MAQKAFTYSFQDVHATIIGPGGTISLGNGAGAAEEGISLEFTEETDTMHVGADGSVAHSLHASRAGKITVRLLKTTPTNALLAAMYNFQRVSSLLHGQNTIAVTNVVTGDVYAGQQVAFARFPTNAYAKEAGTMEWEFNVGRLEVVLGGAGLLLT